MDELPVYYGGDLWRPDSMDYGDSDNYDVIDQILRTIFFAMSGWIRASVTCRMALVPQLWESRGPRGRVLAGTDTEVSISMVKSQQDLGAASVLAMDIASRPDRPDFVDLLSPSGCRDPSQVFPGPTVTFLGPPGRRGPPDSAELGCPDFSKCSGVLVESSSGGEVADMLTTVSEVAVLGADQNVCLDGMCLWDITCGGTFTRPTRVFGLKLGGMDYSRVTLWDLEGVAA